MRGGSGRMAGAGVLIASCLAALVACGSSKKDPGGGDSSPSRTSDSASASASPSSAPSRTHSASPLPTRSGGKSIAPPPPQPRDTGKKRRNPVVPTVPPTGTVTPSLTAKPSNGT
ncbi:hypothetical protein GCM10012280_18980 [Wenjunlia tyrosinilytica]|uniref:Uncharacterized protein n=1 Tax=Wenjunlia tyrosinilytica TaxID=1544741 RepID=A0A918DVM3_9ACTN|nr:hypothetical protein GCM10012280_18980 [Wenjunlia tyrosinilytica]